MKDGVAASDGNTINDYANGENGVTRDLPIEATRLQVLKIDVN